MSGIRVLIVDDEERFLFTYKKLLEKRGISTSTCSNGFDALKILNEHPIDVAVLDVKMPGIDGMELLRMIKQSHPDIEVILLTGNVSGQTEVEGLKLGAFDHLTKPVTIDEIRTKVEQAFQKKQTMESGNREVRFEEPLVQTFTSLDPNKE